MNAFPKIFAIGDDKIKSIFDDDVEITEKIDGSQFGFGKMPGGELFIRSKGARIYPENPNQMFMEGVEYVLSIQNKIPSGMYFYGEYLKNPKHNVLSYDRTPKNHIILFGCSTAGETFSQDYMRYAELFDLESVPVIYNGKIDNVDQILNLLDRISILGKEKIEGLVVKNYNKMIQIGNIYLPLMCGKYVAERFKEVHQKNWKSENTGKGRFDLYKLGFQTEARWQKAVQHLRDLGDLTNTPKDIGNLLKEIHRDIEEEEKENIMKALWKFFGGDIKRTATKGMAEWYKEQLLKRSFA